MTSSEYQQLVALLGRQSGEIDRRFTEIDRRFDDVGGRLGGQFAELRRDMFGHFDEIYRRFERLEQEYQAITRSSGSCR